MHQAKIELAVPRGLQDADTVENIQRLCQVSGLQINNSDLFRNGLHIIQYPHLVGHICQINDGRLPRIEAMQCASWVFGIEGAREHVVALKIVQKRA